MKKDIEINEVLSKLKKELNISRDIDLAGFLEVKPSTLSTWKKRNSIDYRRLISKCLSNGIELNKLFAYGQKEKIIEAALELFAEKGYAETSIDYIAQKAGLPKESVYQYYDSKTEILNAIFSKVKEKEELSKKCGLV